MLFFFGNVLMHLTVAIATWNRAALLAQTIESLAALVVPAQVTWDLIVCDNNSTDDTRATVERMLELPALKALAGYEGGCYLFEKTQGKSHALNRILREARGQWILFLDDDVVVLPQWLAAMTQAMARHEAAAVLGGAVLPRLEQPLRGRKAFLLEHYPGVYGVTAVASDVPIKEGVSTPGGANMAVRRDAALAVGFDTERGMFHGRRIAGEDMMMALRIIEAGHEGWMVADAKVLHHTPSESLGTRRLIRWQMGIGRVWAIDRGPPTPGKLGVAWWAWREMARRAMRVCLRWRPWVTRGYYDALVAAAQYWGYLRAK